MCRRLLAPHYYAASNLPCMLNECVSERGFSEPMKDESEDEDVIFVVCHPRPPQLVEALPVHVLGVVVC